MTSRRWLIKLMKQAAERKNVTFESIRQGGVMRYSNSTDL